MPEFPHQIGDFQRVRKDHRGTRYPPPVRTINAGNVRLAARDDAAVQFAYHGLVDLCRLRRPFAHPQNRVMVIDGFEVRDAAGTGIRNNGSFVTLRRNWVHHNGTRCDPITVDKCGQGIASNNTPNKLGIVIERNVASFNGSGGKSEDHDYYLHGQGMIVRNNVAIAADDFGFQIYPDCDDCLIYNNVAFGNRLSGFLIGGSIVDNAYSTNVKVFNNISVGNGQRGFTFYQPGNQPMTMRNNLAFANAAGAIFIPAGFTALDNANLFQVDPLFVDAGGYDFHLRPGSPAIDTGDPSLAPPDDIDGDLRIQGAGVELGIDEVPGPPFDAGLDGGPQGKPDGGQAADGGPMNSPDAGVPLGAAARGCGCGTDRAALAAWLSALAGVAVSRRARTFAARR